MLDPEVKWIDYSDEPPPNDGSPFELAITVGIGPRGDESDYNFQLLVCNLARVQERLAREPAIWARGLLILERFDIDHIHAILQDLAKTFRRSKDWMTFGERLNRYMLWEFEDMDDFQGNVTVPASPHSG